MLCWLVESSGEVASLNIPQVPNQSRVQVSTYADRTTRRDVPHQDEYQLSTFLILKVKGNWVNLWMCHLGSVRQIGRRINRYTRSSSQFQKGWWSLVYSLYIICNLTLNLFEKLHINCDVRGSSDVREQNLCECKIWIWCKIRITHSILWLPPWQRTDDLFIFAESLRSSI